MPNNLDKATSKKVQPLSVEDLKRKTNIQKLKTLLEQDESREQLAPFGQKRAIEAINFGLDIGRKGYNIFVLGSSGVGKASITSRLVKLRAAQEKRPNDMCYAYNFEDKSRPLFFQLPSGIGNKLQKAIEKSLLTLSLSMSQALSDERFQKRLPTAVSDLQKEMDDIFEKIKEIAAEFQLEVEKEDDQFVVIPLIEGIALEEEYSNLSTEEQDSIEKRVTGFQKEAMPLLQEQKEKELELEEKLKAVEREAIKGLVEGTIEGLIDSFKEEEGTELVSYFKQMKEHLLEHYKKLIQAGAKTQVSSKEEEDIESETAPEPSNFELPLAYKINVLVTHKKDGAPVLTEKEPSLLHLFGYLEYKEVSEGYATDHTMIRAGALHRANGGYLILQAGDLIRSPETLQALKRALKHHEIQLRDLTLEPEKPRIFGTIHPQEVPLDLKIILIGSLEEYYYLMTLEESFDRLFKVKAEFESTVLRNENNEVEYCSFLNRLASEEGLLTPTLGSLAKMLEESSRVAGTQKKLSTSMVASIDLLRESDYWARNMGVNNITEESVSKALHFRDYSREGIERDILETIEEGELMIDTDGQEIGQINGLVVYSMLDHQFGVPAKITARTWAGFDGVMNIDREARLSGEIHEKGSMILIGLLGGFWGQNHSLAFNASITFEQVYGEIEGDSASCAEFYALLSSLSKVPIQQGIAITGSVNQQGYIQPIGGVNEKIEGMFKICNARGLTGKQGVIIPVQNVSHLMLHDEVVEAVKQGKFHIWGIRHIYDGIELLMGMPSGTRDADNNWTPGSLFAKIQERFDQFYKIELQRIAGKSS